ncbi:MAG TPA: PIN domain-containing protein [Blastocatellia bacterium]|jgi:uncharacterized protein
MKLLLDANIFLEILLKQPKAAEARTLLESDKHEFHLSLFSLYSIGILLERRNRSRQWFRFLRDSIQTGYVKVLTLSIDELTGIFSTARQFSLDFDDAYQYLVAEIHHLTLVSFDKDFDFTPRGRMSPQAINLLASTNAPTPQDQE